MIAPPKSYVEEAANGSLCVAGSDVDLAAVYEAFAHGMTAEEIRSGYRELPLSSVYGAIAYILSNRQQVEAYVQRVRDEYETSRAAAATVNPALRSKLDAVRKTR